MHGAVHLASRDLLQKILDEVNIKKEIIVTSAVHGIF